MKQSQQPNVLFILADQHNAKVLGHKGHPDVQTPNLDRMAAQGVRFDCAVSQNPICTPSRVSFLSGQYCHNHGYYGLSGPNPGGLPTLLGHFRLAGYLTGAVGKIHCPESWVENDCDVFHETCKCSIGGRSAAYTKFLKDRGKEDLEDHIAMAEFGPAGMQSMEGRPSKVSFEEAQEGWIAKTINDTIDQAIAEGKPFCLHASLPRPHQCTAPSEPFWAMYEGKNLTLPPNADNPLENRAPHLRQSAENWRKGHWALIEPKTFDAARMRKLRGYLGAVSQVDHAVGLMLKHLEEKGIAENTIVVYSADHGDYACEHGIMEKAPGICSDAITRIPFIWQWKGHLKAGHVARELVESVDVANTLCALAGLEPLETADGKDLSALLKGGNGTVKDVAVTEFAWSKSIYKGKYRYVHYPREMFAKEYPGGFGELFDLEADPWEMKNLYFDPGHAAVLADMKASLMDWLITSTRPVTVHPPPGHLRSGSQFRTRYHHSVNADNKMHPDRIRKSPPMNYL